MLDHKVAGHYLMKCEELYSLRVSELWVSALNDIEGLIKRRDAEYAETQRISTNFNTPSL